MSQKPIITLLTDFGNADGYVGVMKGVMLGIVPDAHLVDISHAISPQNVRQAAFVLHSVYAFFPPGTVHMVVVDPGVGSARRPIARRTPTAQFVGPDNGVFSYVMASEPVGEIVELSEPRYRLAQVSNTFHGRDIFSPAAAHLAAGVPISDLGPGVTDPVLLPTPGLTLSGDALQGEVLHADHFGNVITSIGRLIWQGDDLVLSPSFGASIDRPVCLRADSAQISIAGQTLAGVRRTYAEVASGQALALVGSEGYLEIAVREGDGAAILGLRPGDLVTLRSQALQTIV